ncbi:uncharacterized protein METZ01_LOCUS72820, partial [marine metagenome]
MTARKLIFYLTLNKSILNMHGLRGIAQSGSAPALGA